jgi:hypothetical protein
VVRFYFEGAKGSARLTLVGTEGFQCLAPEAMEWKGTNADRGAFKVAKIGRPKPIK